MFRKAPPKCGAFLLSMGGRRGGGPDTPSPLAIGRPPPRGGTNFGFQPTRALPVAATGGVRQIRGLVSSYAFTVRADTTKECPGNERKIFDSTVVTRCRYFGPLRVQ